MAWERSEQWPLRVSAYLPNWTNGLAHGRQPRWPELAATAEWLEEIGVDGLWVADQLRQEFDDQPALAFWESWTLIAALATKTSRVTLGPLVSSAGFRNPAVVANMAATIDEISGGRVVVGLGAGYDEREHRAHGFPWERPVARLEEAAAILDDLLHRGQSSREGHWYATHAASLDPPAASARLVIGTLGGGPRIFRTVARHADGWASWLAFDSNDPAVMAGQIDRLGAAFEEVGRDVATLHRIACVSVRLSDEPFRFGPYDLAEIAIAGEPGAIAERLRAFEPVADEVALYAFPLTPVALDTLAAILAALDA